MTSPLPQLTLAACADHVRDVVFADALGPGDPVRHRVGIELEWLTAGADHERLAAARVEGAIDALSPFASGSRLTMEPGGQLELSSAPATEFDALCHTTATELFQIDRWCAANGIELLAIGADPARRPERVLQHPRYEAMEEYFDSMGPAGRTMMCNTASIQLNVGFGDPRDMVDRWRIANRLGPVLLAAFANSPLAASGPTGWASTRLRSWWTLDPSRSAPVDSDIDPVRAWTDYAVAARVMFIRAGDGRCVPLTEPLTFAEWVHQGHELGWPTLDDFAYHLTTLFPPVRPRGWLELRYFDALPTPFWLVAVAVAYACIVDADTRAAVHEHLDRTGAADLWVDAAQLGLGHPALQVAAQACFDSARAAMPQMGVGVAITELVDSYIDRWVSRGRCPADDRLDTWRATGQLFPPRESPVPYGRDVRSTAP